MQYDVILARYGELGLKSTKVRRRFELALARNIERAFEKANLDVVVRRIPGRFLVTSSDLPRAVAIVSRVFGLTSVSPACTVPSKMQDVTQAVQAYLKDLGERERTPRTFAVRARRSGQHPYTSQDVARESGAYVLASDTSGRWKVDLGDPDVAVHVDVRDNRAYVYHERVAAPGGLPQGTQGRVVALLKDANSLVAAWLMLKRGCRVIPVTFVGPTGQPERVEQWRRLLSSWHHHDNVVEIGHHVASEYPPSAACLLCMRRMLRQATGVARRKRARALVTGETFASTTSSRLLDAQTPQTLPVLRPLLGLPSSIVREIAGQIGLSETEFGDGRHACPLRTLPTATLDEVEAWEQAHDAPSDGAGAGLRVRT